MKIRWHLLLAAGLFITLTGSVCTPQALPTRTDVAGIVLPQGFHVSVFADKIVNARQMTWGEKGTLFVGNRAEDKVYAIRDENGDWIADQTYVIAKGLRSPNGVAFRNGSLYIAEISRILRLDNIEQNLATPPTPVVVTDTYPTEGHHGWKYIAFGPDGMLYVPVGAPCNICLSENEIYAGITRMKPDGSQREVIAHGVRNTVGFDWDTNGDLWFTDNGRDWLGDESPPDELNHITTTGQHFGYPFCHSGDTPDPEFGKQKPCTDFVPPAQKLGPHVAALGMKFYTGKMFPEKYRGGIFIAEHGSWNRSSPLGYRVSFVPVKDGKAQGYETFAEGWLNNKAAWGRPVDIVLNPDGSMLLSDDTDDKIYRIWYGD